MEGAGSPEGGSCWHPAQTAFWGRPPPLSHCVCWLLTDHRTTPCPLPPRRPQTRTKGIQGCRKLARWPSTRSQPCDGRQVGSRGDGLQADCSPRHLLAQPLSPRPGLLEGSSVPHMHPISASGSARRELAPQQKAGLSHDRHEEKASRSQRKVGPDVAPGGHCLSPCKSANVRARHDPPPSHLLWVSFVLGKPAAGLTPWGSQARTPFHVGHFKSSNEAWWPSEAQLHFAKCLSRLSRDGAQQTRGWSIFHHSWFHRAANEQVVGGVGRTYWTGAEQRRRRRGWASGCGERGLLPFKGSYGPCCLLARQLEASPEISGASVSSSGKWECWQL